MRKFVGYASNGEFSVGCTGGTVWLYDKQGKELRKFKDITYGYTPMISPDGKIFVVKSTVGLLAVYSLESLSLLKKFRFSKVSGSQNDGFCFSPDGKLFLNVERQRDSLHSAISVYDTTDFSLADQILFDEDMMISCIEYDRAVGTYYVLGFARDMKTRVIDHGFIAEFANRQLKNMVSFPSREKFIYHDYKHLEIMGFTEMVYELSSWLKENLEGDLDKLKSMDFSLAKLHKQHSENGTAE